MEFSDSITVPILASPQKLSDRASAHWLVGGCGALWIAVLAFAPSLFRYVFPATSLLCAGFLYLRQGASYVGFTWVLYFVSPLFKRMVELRTGVGTGDLIMAAPLLANAICAAGLLNIRKVGALDAPFLILALLIFCGVPLSLVDGAAANITLQFFLSWLGPMALGFYLSKHPEFYNEVRSGLQNVFLVGLAGMSLYGVLQYVHPLSWDIAWMENNADKITSFGTPEPFGIRVYGSMNSPQTLAVTLLFGVFLLLPRLDHLVAKATVAVTYVVLVLTMARSAWLACVLGLFCFALLVRFGKSLYPVLTTLGGVVVLTIGLVFASPAGQQLQNRFSSLQDGSHDESYQSRQNGYDYVLSASWRAPLGYGWGVETSDQAAGTDLAMHDSTLVELLLTLGWFGALAFYLSTAWACWKLVAFAWISHEPFLAAMASVAVACLIAESFLNSLLGGAPELVLFTAIGLGYAATRQQSATRPSQAGKVLEAPLC